MKGRVLPAVILRLADYGEADRVVTLLTSVEGKVTALARGARKSRQRFGGLTLFAIGEATVSERARSTLDLLDGFFAARGLPGLASDMASIAHAGYASELVEGLLAPRQPEPEIFRLLIDFLGALDGQGAHTGRLRAFELRFWGLVGLAPTLANCVVCERRDLDGAGQLFDAHRGGVVCAHCRGSANAQASELDHRARAALLAGQTGEGEQTASEPEVDRACRVALGALATLHLGHPPRALSFMAKLNRAAHSNPAR